ncbi:TetR/AcrR family transcriptional regulator [Streptomyces shenzhenensis]|uniref:TetR/AcrR family transcriptional regulator n=1 Tax=Streptomyces shenzhenensis TaxID=943815 RepID=UPI0037F2D5E7
MRPRIACYAYLLEHGLLGLSPRPLAAATGTSPRVLLYLFGSKDALLRELLARARRDQVTQLAAALDEQAREMTREETRGRDHPPAEGPAATPAPAAFDALSPACGPSSPRRDNAGRSA